MVAHKCPGDVPGSSDFRQSEKNHHLRQCDRLCQTDEKTPEHPPSGCGCRLVQPSPIPVLGGSPLIGPKAMPLLLHATPAGFNMLPHASMYLFVKFLVRPRDTREERLVCLVGLEGIFARTSKEDPEKTEEKQCREEQHGREPALHGLEPAKSLNEESSRTQTS